MTKQTVTDKPAPTSKSRILLKEAGLKATASRLRVLALLEESSRPLSASEIIAALKNQNAKIDQVTVYRVLESIKASRLVHEINPGKKFLLCTHIVCCDKLHLITHCDRCGKTVEQGIPAHMVEAMIEFLKKEKGFLARKHFLQIDGHCQSC